VAWGSVGIVTPGAFDGSSTPGLRGFGTSGRVVTRMDRYVFAFTTDKVKVILRGWLVPESMADHVRRGETMPRMGEEDGHG